MQLQEWEKKIGITKDRFKDHHGYYLEMSKAFGIGWPDNESKFMGHDVEYWKEKYNKDEHLNNHPLEYFDSCYGYHRMIAGRLGVPISPSMTVCMLKAVIKQKVADSN